MINSALYKTLLTLYHDVWNRDWPHDRKTVSELWFEAKMELGVSRQSKRNVATVKALTVEKMRYDHQF